MIRTLMQCVLILVIVYAPFSYSEGTKPGQNPGWSSGSDWFQPWNSPADKEDTTDKNSKDKDPQNFKYRPTFDVNDSPWHFIDPNAKNSKGKDPKSSQYAFNLDDYPHQDAYGGFHHYADSSVEPDIPKPIKPVSPSKKQPASAFKLGKPCKAVYNAINFSGNCYKSVEVMTPRNRPFLSVVVPEGQNWMDYTCDDNNDRPEKATSCGTENYKTPKGGKIRQGRAFQCCYK